MVALIAAAIFARTWIGVEAQPMTKELRVYFGAPEGAGVLVVSVVDKSPAARAGLRAGDVIVKAGNAEVNSVSDLVDAVGDVEPGAALALQLVREKKAQRLEVKVERNPDFPDWDRAQREWKQFEHFARMGRDRALEELQERLDKLERELEELRRDLKKK